MNREWSELNRKMQSGLAKRADFNNGISTLFELRNTLLRALVTLKDELADEQFSAMPFPKAKGYHCKTIAYSVWHIFRIEDIVAHTLVKGDSQVFFSGDYQKRIGSPIITTGNELTGEQIAEFSSDLDISELYSYILDVKQSTEDMIGTLTFDDMKMKIPQERKDALVSLGTVSTDENAVWLIDYWFSKDIAGLIRMPFSRHWIMHTEAALRIRNGINKYK